jgi:hypothetical protein
MIKDHDFIISARPAALQLAIREPWSHPATS